MSGRAREFVGGFHSRLARKFLRKVRQNKNQLGSKTFDTGSLAVHGTSEKAIQCVQCLQLRMTFQRRMRGVLVSRRSSTLVDLVQKIANGGMGQAEAVRLLEKQLQPSHSSQTELLGNFARFDHSRAARTGIPEVPNRVYPSINPSPTLAGYFRRGQVC